MDQEQFDNYQHFTEKTIYDLSQKVIVLENKLNIITNLLEISKFINQYIKDPNLFGLINDMIIGVFGAKYSIIYEKISDSWEIVARSAFYSYLEEEKKLIIDHQEAEFIINSDTPIYGNQKEEDNVYSCLGVPIKVDNQILGFIIIQHKEKNYFSSDHLMFLSSIGNHIGVAIENNLLYKQIKEQLA
ncbi:MAG: GAF domain-containing protein [Herbinix sp.]|nr:GAF domain-containing protein [Herbinix sp.]